MNSTSENTVEDDHDMLEPYRLLMNWRQPMKIAHLVPSHVFWGHSVVAVWCLPQNSAYRTTSLLCHIMASNTNKTLDCQPSLQTAVKPLDYDNRSLTATLTTICNAIQVGLHRSWACKWPGDRS